MENEIKLRRKTWYTFDWRWSGSEYKMLVYTANCDDNITATVYLSLGNRLDTSGGQFNIKECFNITEKSIPEVTAILTKEKVSLPSDLNYTLKDYKFNIGDYVEIVHDTSGSCNKIGDIGVIGKRGSASIKDSYEVSVPNRRSTGNISWSSDLKPSSKEEYTKKYGNTNTKTFPEKWVIKPCKEVGDWIDIKCKELHKRSPIEGGYANTGLAYLVYPPFGSSQSFIHDSIPEGYAEITLEEFNKHYSAASFLPGRWYRYTAGYTDMPTYAKYSSKQGSSDRFYYDEIIIQGSYNNTHNWSSVDCKPVLLPDLTVIQDYLPSGHIDSTKLCSKNLPEGTYVKLIGNCNSSSNVIGDIGIVSRDSISNISIQVMVPKRSPVGNFSRYTDIILSTEEEYNNQHGITAFKVPEKWCVLSTNETKKVLYDFIVAEGYTPGISMNNSYYHYPLISTQEAQRDTIHVGYTPITFEQFEKYILKSARKSRIHINPKLIKANWYKYITASDVWLFKFDEFSASDLWISKCCTLNDGYKTSSRGVLCKKNQSYYTPTDEEMKEVYKLFPEEDLVQVKDEWYKDLKVGDCVVAVNTTSSNIPGNFVFKTINKIDGFRFINDVHGDGNGFGDNTKKFRKATEHETALFLEHGPCDVTKAKLNTKSLNIKKEEFLKLAKEKYPIGTKFIPAHATGTGTICNVTTTNFTLDVGINKDSYIIKAITSKGNTYGDNEGNTPLERTVYYGDKWAEIVNSEPITGLPKVIAEGASDQILKTLHDSYSKPYFMGIDPWEVTLNPCKEVGTILAYNASSEVPPDYTWQIDTSRPKSSVPKGDNLDIHYDSTSSEFFPKISAPIY